MSEVLYYSSSMHLIMMFEWAIKVEGCIRSSVSGKPTDS